MRIATWNVNSLKVRLPKVEEWLAYAQPDVLCMQETKLADSAFPAMAFSALGYESAHCGEGRWNGVAILSRVGIDDVSPASPTRPRTRPSRPAAVGDVRRRAGGQRVRAERAPGRAASTTRPSWRGSTACAATSSPGATPLPTW